MPTGELDPAYFDPDEWEFVEDGDDSGLYQEYFVHEETDQRVTPERFAELRYEAQTVENADVITRDKLRRLIDRLEARADDNERKAGPHDEDTIYDGIMVGRNRSAADLAAVLNGEMFDGE